jgi:hypothetical protein
MVYMMIKDVWIPKISKGKILIENDGSLYYNNIWVCALNCVYVQHYCKKIC